MKEMGDKFSRMMEEFREGFKSQERILNEMMEEMRRGFRKQMDKWREEKEELKGNKEIEDRIEELEWGGSTGKERDRRGGIERNEVIEKIRKIERRLEVREKEERRKNEGRGG